MVTEKKKRRASARRPRVIELDPTSDEALHALDAKMAVAPDMPVSVAVREYGSLARLAKSLAREFGKIGISAEQIEALARFAKRLRALEARWQRARSAVFLSVKERKALEEAEALDSKFVAGGRWACREDDEALAELDRISAGSGLEDTLQDLRDELDFWRVHADVLRFTDITAKDLKRAEQLVEALESAAEKEGGDVDAAAALDLRNRCFWAADKLARLIREGGRYAFRDQPTVLAKLPSRYRVAAVRRARRGAQPKKKGSAGAGNGVTPTSPAPAAPIDA